MIFVSGMQRLAFILVMGLCLTSYPALAQFNAFKDPTSGKAGAAAGPDLKAVQDSIVAGKVAVGTTAYVVTVFQNNGTQPVKTLGVNLYPSSGVAAQVNLNKCAEEPLPPEGQCAITVAVTGLQAGAYRVEVLIDHDGRSRLAKAAITGEAESSSTQQLDKVKMDVEAVPETLDFGSVNSGLPLVRSILLRNRTADPVTLTNLKLDSAALSGFKYVSECPERLVAGESCVVNVTWTPQVGGLTEGVLLVGHSANSSLTKVDIKGTYQPPTGASAAIYPESVPDMGLLVADKTEVNFGTGINSVSSNTVMLVNSGYSALTLKNIRLAGSDSGLSLSRDGCRVGTEITPGGACVLTISWTPNRAGALVDDLQVLHTGARGVLVLPIRGEAAAAAPRDTSSLQVRQSSLPMLDGGSQAETGGQRPRSAGEARTTPPDLNDVADVLANMGASLDGVSVTSMSAQKAVLSGPGGSIIVRNGRESFIGGARWMATIVENGVVLSREHEDVTLFFDKSFRIGTISPAEPEMTTTATSSSTSEQ